MFIPLRERAALVHLGNHLVDRLTQHLKDRPIHLPSELLVSHPKIRTEIPAQMRDKPIAEAHITREKFLEIFASKTIGRTDGI